LSLGPPWKNKISMAQDDPAARWSASSSYPDTGGGTVQLSADVHRVPPNDIAAVPLSALKFRALTATDLEETKALHAEWFPVRYDDAFYSSTVDGEYTSIAATHEFNVVDESGQSHKKELFLGMIVFTNSSWHDSDSADAILGSTWSCRKRDLAYVFTFGVIDEYRRKGLARNLLRQAIEHLETWQRQVQAIYLHVIAFNESAMRLYESEGFLQIQHKSDFYHIAGQSYDAYLYARYLNDGKPPLAWRMQQTASNWWQWWSDALRRAVWTRRQTTGPPVHA